jgi:hypothetical protein
MNYTGWVFLAVGNANCFKIAQISVHGKQDDSFFEDLGKAYREIRGTIDRIFSIWVYSHCNFMKVSNYFITAIVCPLDLSQFENIEYEMHVPVAEELPPDSDPDASSYIFQPRPPSRMPPIHPIEFNLRYYGCFKCGRWHKGNSSTCPAICRRKLKALDRMPKRNRPLAQDGNERHEFWGLLAVDIPSFWKIVVYHLLFLVFPFMFWILWLTVMKHPADLQNASVPVVSAVGFLSVFWAMMTHRPDPKYGRYDGKVG